MIPRTLAPALRSAAQRFPVAILTGPRQSGKTTLARQVFPDVGYVSLERPDQRQRALTDPLALLAGFPGGAVIDEVQRVPQLLSFLQAHVDENPGVGRWVLTGSHNLMLMSSVSQSLAGRAALLTLPPFSHAELTEAGRAPVAMWDAVWRGSYPALFDRDVQPGEWLGAYISTYIERDVREILEIRNLGAFQTFLALAAARTGALQNSSALGSDVGISHVTATAWLSLLEASYICYALRPFFRNLGKRLTKTPKLHFWDTGVVCQLLGILAPDQLELHPLRGAVFETWVVGEILKWHLGRAIKPDLTFYRDHLGLEVDLIVRAGSVTTLVEVKSGRTVGADAYGNLEQVAVLMARDPLGTSQIRKRLVYGGDESFTHGGVDVVPWHQVGQRDWG